MGFALAGLSAAYAGFRGSIGFVLILCGSIVTCVAAHLTIGFDPDWGMTNLGLSMEASISVSLLMMATEKQDRLQRQQLKYLLHLIEANHAALVAQSMVRRGEADASQDARMDAEE